MGSNPGGEQNSFLDINTFCKHVFLEFSFDNTVTLHSKHALKWDSSEIKRMSSGNSNMLITNGYLLLFVLYSTLKALVYREDREQLSLAVVRSCQNHVDKTVVNQFSCGLYLPYVQRLFTTTNNGNFTTCNCSSIQ